MNELKIETAIQIYGSVKDVFEAIADPARMSHYFISESTGRMESGRELIWKFPEFSMEIPVKVVQVIPNERILFEWEGAPQVTLKVEIKLLEKDETVTLVEISEGTMKADQEGILWYGRNSGGWANFLACLKAYIEYGINLRKGAFDHLSDKHS